MKLVEHNQYTYLDEHWDMYRIVESLNCIPKTNIMLYLIILQLKEKDE